MAEDSVPVVGHEADGEEGEGGWVSVEGGMEGVRDTVARSEMPGRASVWKQLHGLCYLSEFVL